MHKLPTINRLLVYVFGLVFFKKFVFIIYSVLKIVLFSFYSGTVFLFLFFNQVSTLLIYDHILTCLPSTHFFSQKLLASWIPREQESIDNTNASFFFHQNEGPPQH